MWLDNYLSKHLKEGEEPLKVVRRYGLTLVPGLAGAAVLVLLDFFLLAWWLQWRGGGMIGFLIILGLALWWAGRTLFLWSRNILILTNHRIIDIDQLGLLHRTVAEAPYAKIQDVRYTTRGVWQTIFHFGTVIIQTAGSTTNLEITRVRNPQVVQQLITDIQREVAQAPNGGQPEDIASALAALRQALAAAPGFTPKHPTGTRQVEVQEAPDE